MYPNESKDILIIYNAHINLIINTAAFWIVLANLTSSHFKHDVAFPPCFCVNQRNGTPDGLLQVLATSLSDVTACNAKDKEPPFAATIP
ncbi:hypothetical protein BN1200_1110007 [Klebsiella variicola]|nr:hypothetical protein BN1200_1110007 [Klebsiella variicola]CTQ17942.1 hypothetical protein BN1200_1840003 [Klebsiella variicola]